MSPDGAQDGAGPQQRLFFGVPVPGDIAPQLERVQEQFRPVLARAAWMPARNFHVTLRFLGDTWPEAAERIIESIASVVPGLTPGVVSIRDIGVFPSWREPRVLWAGCTDAAGLLPELHRRVEAGLSRAGRPADRERFHPHVTLARIRHRAGAASSLTSLSERFMGTDLGSWRVADLVLYRSDLRPEGAVYQVVRRFPF